MLKNVDTDFIKEACVTLTPYAVRLRYPNEIVVDENQARVAIDYAARVKDWAQAAITKN